MIFMESRIIGSTTDLHDWFQTPPGRYLLAWECDQFDRAVADIFGYHALQLGLPELDSLRANRMPHRWLALQTPGGAFQGEPLEAPAGFWGAASRLALRTDFAALPFPAGSLDLVTLAHSLELNADPHATLREVERVLVPDGRVVICGLNPASLWGLRQRRAHLCQRLGFGELYLPDAGEFIGYWRLRDWLRLLGFDVEFSRFGCHGPAVRTEQWLRRFAFMERAGERWWPIFGAAYFIVAVKRVRGMTLLSAPWKSAKAVSITPVSVANYHQPTLGTKEKNS
jgi:SAM-dependent methyltransferase